jgi:DNA-binding SARP family transcriptional activator
MGSLQIRLLGGFRAVRVDLAQPVSSWQRGSAKTLTKLLAAHPGHAMHREQVLEVLWPRCNFESALNSFGKALHAARHATEPELPPRGNSTYLQLSDSIVSLNAEHVVIDTDRFRDLAEDALRRRDIAAFESALATYGGELLPEDRYEDWCAERRSSLAELRVEVLLGLAEALERQGARHQSADRLRQALEQEPTREEVHRRLMRLYGELGIRDQAVRQFHICRDVLRRELDLAPQHDTESLYQDILADRIPHIVERETVSPRRPRSAPANPFVGREPVLEHLRERLASASGGRGGMILVSGESGVGKSRLIEEFATHARRQGAAVLWGGSGAHASPFTCGAFAVAFEDFLSARPEVERSQLAQRYPALARLLPSLPTESSPLFADAPGDDLALAVVRFLTDLTREQAVVLVLGDLEDGDRFSLDLLRYLAHLAVTRRWLIIGALREEAVPAGTELRQVIDAMTRERLYDEIELQPLSRQECARLVRALLTGNHDGDELVEQIYAQSRGNPLFAGELIRELRERGELNLTSAGWRSSSCLSPRPPARVRALVAMRLGGVDETVRRVLALAAAVGPTDISLAEIRSGAAALDPPLSEAALYSALDRALEMRMLEEHESGYAFRHPLVCAALYEDLPWHRRDQLLGALRRSRAQRSHRLHVAASG